MAIYDAVGNELDAFYNVSGTQIYKAYDVQGDLLVDAGGGSEEEHADWSGMSVQFRDVVSACADECVGYMSEHNGAFAFPVFTDVHLYTDGNEPNYVAFNYPDTFAMFVFLGDITNLYNSAQLDSAVTYMDYATDQKKIAAIGNHEWGDYDTTGSNAYPREWYKPLLPDDCVFFQDDGLTYYCDSVSTNVRVIVMDSNSTVKKQSGTQKFNMDALNWLAGVLENSGTKDIIVLNHAMGSGFYLVTDTEHTDWKSDTTIANMTTFNNIITAFMDKTSLSITVDGVSYTHDFSGTSGRFVGYITGHYHNAGYTNNWSYNKITCTAVTRNKPTDHGMTFFVIDPAERLIKMLIARYPATSPEEYEYTF